LRMILLLVQVLAAMSTDHEEHSASSHRVLLHDGKTMPMIGLGVALSEDDTYEAVQWALSYGYRLIDTAAEESYGNEDRVAQAIRDWGKDEVFVTTKLWDSDHGFYQTLEAFGESYEKLNASGPIDLYLMHSPFGGRIVETWDAMLFLQSKGYIESIGVANFGVDHLEAIANSGRPLPVVNQIEMHPLLYQQRLPLIKWCQERKIQIQAFGSMMFGYSKWLESELLVNMAGRYKKTTAQILLRWALQHDFLIIPKSVREERIKSNSQLYDFVISEEDMTVLDHWGDSIPKKKRLMYKKSWNWNPIDEADVHLGKTHYWPNFEGVEESFVEDYDYGEIEEEAEGRDSSHEL